MDPLGTAAQAGGTVCWKGQEQACQYQGTANRIFYELALIQWGGGAMQEPRRCVSALQRCPKRAGSLSWEQSSPFLSHTVKPSTWSWRWMGCIQEQLWDLSSPLCSLVHGANCRLQDHLWPGSMVYTLFSLQKTSTFLHGLTAPEQLLYTSPMERKSLKPLTGLSPTLVKVQTSSHSLHQPSPLCSIHTCDK